MVPSEHQGNTIRCQTEDLEDTRQRSFIKQGGIWVSKHKWTILEIKQFYNLKPGRKPPQGRSNYQNSLSSVLLPPSQGKGAWRKSGGALLRAWMGGLPSSTGTKKLWQSIGILEPPALLVPGVRMPCRQCNLLSSTTFLDASCNPNSWLGRWLSAS